MGEASRARVRSEAGDSPKINSSVLGQCMTINPEGNSYNRSKHEIYDSCMQTLTAVKDTVEWMDVSGSSLELHTC